MSTLLVLTPPEAVAGPDLTRYLLVCGLLVGGIVGVGLLTRRVLGHSLKVRAAKRSLQVTDVLPLGGKQRLLVVRCFDRSFLIGQGEKELSTIAELDSLELESMKRLAESPPAADFESTLNLQGETPPPIPTPKRRKPVLEGGQGVVG